MVGKHGQAISSTRGSKTPPCRQTKPLPPELESIDKRQVGVGHSPGVRGGRAIFQAIRPHPPTFNQQQMDCLNQEIATIVEKGAVSPLRTVEDPDGYYSNLFLVPKKDGRH